MFNKLMSKVTGPVSDTLVMVKEAFIKCSIRIKSAEIAIQLIWKI